MTYLKILMYARKGIRAEINHIREMQDKALEGAGANAAARRVANELQEKIDALEVDLETINELQEIHDRE